MNDAWSFHFFWINVVIQVACVVNWTSIFTWNDHRHFYLLTWMVWHRFSSWWHYWIPFIVLESAFHRDFIGHVLYTDGWPGRKIFTGVIPYIQLGCFKVLPITAFHVDATSTWYLLLVLGGEELWWWLLEIRVDGKT